MASSDVDHVLARLHAYLDAPSDEGWTKQCAQGLTQLCVGRNAETFCWSLWQAFVDAAVEDTPGSHVGRIDKLVELVKTIKHSEPMRDEHGKTVSCWNGEFWRDLPIFGPQMRENWNTSPSSPAELPVHLKKNMFAARLTQLDVHDFSLYGLWALRESLEGEISGAPAGPLEYTIPIAHVWSMCAGETLCKLHNNLGSSGRGGSLWDGQSGLCKERWLFWKQRFRTLAAGQECELSPDTRHLAQEAADRMDELLLEG